MKYLRLSTYMSLVLAAGIEGSERLSESHSVSFFQSQFSSLTLAKQPLMSIGSSVALAILHSFFSSGSNNLCRPNSSHGGALFLSQVHTLEEMDRVLGIDGVQMIGINNRDLSKLRLQNFILVFSKVRQSLLKGVHRENTSIHGTRPTPDLKHPAILSRQRIS
jgi:hypothetical protein